MATLPDGTVTLLFSDIESSTALVRTLGPAWGDALDQQRALCRTAWAAHGGHELGTEGDSFFVAFTTAADGIAAARDAQHALARAAWPKNVAVLIRIGLHTGTPQRHTDGYVGLDVHKAARIAAAAHGGQIVLSEAAAHLVRDDLADGAGLLDLGEHGLKDIPQRIRLFQLTDPGLPQKFPLLRTQGGAGNLPTPLTPTVGRDGELAEMMALLADSARLITLTGTGGSGKTRLALTLAGHVADRYPGGVYFVPLEAATTASDAWAGIAHALGATLDAPSVEAVVAHLSTGATLLVLDNLEQVDHADDVCRELLAAAPRLSVVVTSRRALHVDGELEHAVPPLDLPSLTAGEVAASAAVQLFTNLAQAAHREFRLTPANSTTVARLCLALDGMPLALELVAARVKLLSLDQLLDRVDHNLDLTHPDRSRHPRQRTIRATIAWSYQLLTPLQRLALNHLAVFESGADLAAVEAVLPRDALAGTDVTDVLYDLVDASLVQATASDAGEHRYRLLETVKQFAREQLAASGELADAEQAHAQHFYERAKVRLGARRVGDPGPRHASLADLDNVKAVVERGACGIRDPEWYADRPVPAQHAIALFSELAFVVSRYGLALQWARDGLELDGPDADDAGRAALHLMSCGCLTRLDQPVAAIGHGAETRRHFSSSPSSPELPRWADPYRSAVEAEGWVCVAHLELRDVLGARASIDRLSALARPDDQEAADAILELEYELAHELGDFHRAHEFLERFVQSESARAVPPRFRALTINNLADLEMRRGLVREAQQRLAESVDLAVENPWILWNYAATFGAVIGPRHPLLCARTYGALETLREVEGLAHPHRAREEDERVLDPVRSLVPVDQWQKAWDRGRTEPLVHLLREMAALPLPPT